MYEKHPNQTPSAETKQTDRKKKKKNLQDCSTHSSITRKTFVLSSKTSSKATIFGCFNLKYIDVWLTASTGTYSCMTRYTLALLSYASNSFTTFLCFNLNKWKNKNLLLLEGEIPIVNCITMFEEKKGEKKYGKYYGQYWNRWTRPLSVKTKTGEHPL